MSHINYISKREYLNNNAEALERAAKVHNYTEKAWLTFKQANSMNLTVRKGEKGVKLMRLVIIEDKETKKKKKAPVFFTVFNVNQLSEIK